MLREAHAGVHETHGGSRETLDKLSNVGRWPGMYSDVEAYVRNCAVCQMAKLPRCTTHAPSGIARFGYAPMNTLALNHADLASLETTRGNKHILVIVDLFTRYLWRVAVKDRTAKTTARVLHETVLQPCGAPRALVSDDGPAFLGAVCQCLLTMHNVRHFPTTAYRPQANGVVERTNAVIKQRLWAMALADAEWDTRLPAVTSTYNRTIHTATGYAPFHAFYMQEPFPHRADARARS